MTDMRDSTTLFFTLKLKRTRKPIEVFEKMAKKVKKRGATKNWVCEYDDEHFHIDFGDEMSETFSVHFDEKKVCKDFCKVFFPLSGELFDDEKTSEFKALLNMIYSVRTSFSQMEITDDYGISESYLDTKVNKIALRELTEEETERIKRIYEAGHTTVKDNIIALMTEQRELPYRSDYYAYINVNVSFFLSDNDKNEKDFFHSFCESYLFETAVYKGKNRIYDDDDYFGDLTGLYFSISAFIDGIEDITDIYSISLYRTWDPKSTQVKRLLENKSRPLFDAETDPLNKCLLAYRLFLSIYDYLGFTYVGKGKKYNALIMEETVRCIKDLLEDYNSETFHSFKQAVDNEYSRKFKNIKRTISPLAAIEKINNFLPDLNTAPSEKIEKALEILSSPEELEKIINS